MGESVHRRFFCAAGALILTSLSCAAFLAPPVLAAQPFKPGSMPRCISWTEPEPDSRPWLMSLTGVPAD
jgi:hypothetical protein